MVERVSTGVEGMDEFIDGGLPEGFVTLLTGGPGAGKTSFCSHFVQEGLENDEECLYLTTGQKPDDVRSDAKEFGIDFDDHIDNLSMAYISPINANSGTGFVKEHLREKDFDRIVLDSISVFELNWGEKDKIRRYINQLIEHFKDLDATVLITSERPENQSGKLSRYGIAEFLVDGVIVLNGYSLGDVSYRSLQVTKMRKTDINGDMLSLKIKSGNMKVTKERTL